MDIKEPQGLMSTSDMRTDTDHAVKGQNRDLEGDTPSVEANENIFHEFSVTIMDTVIFYHVTKLGRSLFIWIGGPDGIMNDLSYSATTPYDTGLPSSTKLLGNSGETISTALAARLTSKLKKPVYVSINVITRDGTVSNEIEKHLMEEIKLNPSKFS